MLVFRYVTDRAEAPAILDFLRAMHAEVGRAPLNDDKAASVIADTIEIGVALVVENDGRIIGSMGLNRIDYWYADADFLGETWLYVDHKHRKDGEVIGLLMGEARQLGETTGLPVLIDHYRPRKAGAGLSIAADRFEFQPAGNLLALEPRHVLQH